MEQSIVFMDTKDIAKALGCSLPTARAIMRKQSFPLIRVGRSMKVSRDAFLKWSQGRHV